MLNSYLESLPMFVIIYCVLNIKKKNYFWNLLISIGILPFVATIFISIYSTLNGSGLVGDNGGINSGLFALVVSLTYCWYIYIVAIILLIFSIKKKKLNDEKKINIIEKSFMIALIATNIVYLINRFYLDINYRPLFMYRFFNSSDNIYYGIGLTVKKISETGISYYVDYISLIIFMCIISVIVFIFLKIKEKILNLRFEKNNTIFYG